MRPRSLLCLPLLLALLAPGLRAQDLLTRRNGDEVQVKVVEITPDLVKYRRFDNPDGPLVSEYKADVLLIRYANGTKDVFGPTPAAPATAAAPAEPAVPVVRTLNGVPLPPDEDNPVRQHVHLDGPRLGVTLLTAGVVDAARRDADVRLNPLLTQFGWQFETRLFQMPNGVSTMLEFVPLVGGLEQGKFVPSLSGVLGVRGPKGFEFGLGPNLTPLGTSVVLALGTSFRSNGVNFPVNLAVVPGNGGARVSLLFGFNYRSR